MGASFIIERETVQFVGEARSERAEKSRAKVGEIRRVWNFQAAVGLLTRMNNNDKA
jgi:hypothetical protein